jgi:predicted transcriptional regulator
MNKESVECETEVLLLLHISRGAKSRRTILKKLLLKPKNCNQIANEIGFEWWTVQKHLQRLMKENLVKNIDFGRIKFYRITRKGENALKKVTIEEKVA